MFMAATLMMTAPPGLSTRHISPSTFHRFGQADQHVEGGDDIEGGGRKGDGGDTRLRDALQAAPAGIVQARLRQVEPEGLAVRLQQAQVVARATPAVDQAQV
jgi:hypothetical protein